MNKLKIGQKYYVNNACTVTILKILDNGLINVITTRGTVINLTNNNSFIKI
jgi:hypothetical protein